MSDMKLKKVGAIDSVLEPIVAKTDNLEYQLYQKSGKSGHRIRGKYTLVRFEHINAASKEEAIEKAQQMIDDENDPEES